ncbi:putative gustatory receptor 28b [Athalia rosae]|uniref:putative gustatory receptor 28b n=1 Tax=Athalia rosae TaxID=37344 RepID=UPI0020337103|nr:putative gustatory receptor 28b [Athalia rosae]
MFLPRPTTLRNALSPAIVASWFLGYGIFEYPFGHPHPKASLCWSILTAVLYLVVSMVADIRPMEILGFPKSQLSNRVYDFGVYINIVLVLVTSLRGRIWEKKTSLRLEKISAIDDTLKMLGVPEDYSSIFKTQIVQLSAYFLLIAIPGIVTSTLYANHFASRLSYLCCIASLCYGTLYIFLVDTRICELFRYIGRCFERLNDCLVQTAVLRSHIPNEFHLNPDRGSAIFPMSREIHGNRRLFAATGSKWMIHVLRQTRIIHSDLCVLGIEMNSTFSVHILISLILNVLNVISLLFFTGNWTISRGNFHPKYETVGLLLSSAWLSLQLIKLFQFVYICSKTSSQSRRTGKLIYEFLSSTTNDDIGQEIHSLSLQLIQNPLLFTAGGMFKLDFGSLIEIGGLIVTYVVIMIQMNIAHET